MKNGTVRARAVGLIGPPNAVLAIGSGPPPASAEVQKTSPNATRALTQVTLVLSTTPTSPALRSPCDHRKGASANRVRSSIVTSSPFMAATSCEARYYAADSAVPSATLGNAAALTSLRTAVLPATGTETT